MGMDHIQEIQGWAEDGRLLKSDSKRAKEMGGGGTVGRAQGNCFKLRLWWWLLNFLYILKSFYLWILWHVNYISGSWWWTGKPGVLQSMGWQRDRTERLNWKICLQNQTHTGAHASLSKDGGNSKTHCTLEILLEHYRYFKKCMYAWIQNILMYKSRLFFDLSETTLRKLKIKFVQVIWYHRRVTWCSPFIMLNFYNIWITHWVCKVVVLFCWTIFKY